MRATGVLITLSMVLILHGCKTLGPKSQEWPHQGWTQQDVMSSILSRSVPHHWGQKGEETPNSGWSEYAYVKYSSNERADRFIVLRQDQDELSAELYIDNAKAMHAISIIGAGIFYRGESAPTCIPDHIEAPGIEAELFLFLLAKAFPNGPKTVDRKMTKMVHVAEAVIWFMQAHVRLSDLNAEITIEPVGISEYVIQISVGSEKLTLNWKGRGGEVVASSEPLSNWLTCWYGFRKTKGKDRWQKPFIEDAESLQTFGQLRNRLGKPSHTP